jgi:hypothetical protein
MRDEATNIGIKGKPAALPSSTMPLGPNRPSSKVMFLPEATSFLSHDEYPPRDPRLQARILAEFRIL